MGRKQHGGLKMLKGFRLLNSIFRNIILYQATRASSCKAELQGRDLVSSSAIDSSELKSLLWTAIELKRLSRREKCHILEPFHISVLIEKQNPEMQVSFESAIKSLGGRSTSYLSSSLNGHMDDYTDGGKLYSALSDCVVAVGMKHDNLVAFADAACVPVLNANSDMCSLTKAIAILLTMHEVFGPFRRKCVAWVGPLTPLCNSLLCLLPKVGVNQRICCLCRKGGGHMTAYKFMESLSLCRDQAELHECLTAEEAVYRADLIVSSQHASEDQQITLKMLEEAALDWYYIHSLPRSPSEVNDDVHRHAKNLSWKCVENIRFVAMAMLTRTLTSYETTMSFPDFEGPP